MTSSEFNVLVAEDSKMYRSMLSDMLKREGFNVTLASDGNEALEKICSKAKEFHLMMLDLNMPNMDGIELLEALKKNNKGCHLPPTLILTASTPNPELLLKFRKLGAKGYIVKSRSTDEIIYRIKSIAKQGEEGRKDLRELLSIPIEYSIGSSFISVRSFDFTKNGSYIATTNPLPVGEITKVRFTIPSAKRTFNIRAKVMFNIKLDSSKAGTYPPGMGIKFLDLSEEDHKTIDSHISFLLKKQP